MKLARRTTKSNAYRYILNAASVCALAIQEPLNWIKNRVRAIKYYGFKKLTLPRTFPGLAYFSAMLCVYWWIYEDTVQQTNLDQK